MNKRFLTLLTLGSVWITAFVAIPVAAQVPALPHAFYGAADVHGGPAPVGAQIEARGTGVKIGIQGNPIAVTVAGRYGGPTLSEPKLGVQGTVEDNAPIEFFIDGMKAQVAVPGGDRQDSYAFQAGVITQLNLRVAEEAPPTSTPAPTATPTVAEPTSTPVPTTVPTVAEPTPTPTRQPTEAPAAQPTPASAAQLSTTTLVPAAPLPAMPSPTPSATGALASAPIADGPAPSPTPPANPALPGPAPAQLQPEPPASAYPAAPLQAPVMPTLPGVAPAAQATISVLALDGPVLATPSAVPGTRSDFSSRVPRPTRSIAAQDSPGHGDLLAIIAIGSLVAALVVIAAMAALVLCIRG